MVKSGKITKLSLSKGQLLGICLLVLLLMGAYWYFYKMDPRAENIEARQHLTSEKMYAKSTHVFIGRTLRQVGEMNLPEKECQYEVEITANPLKIKLKGDVPDKVIISSATCFPVDPGKIPPQHDGKSGTVLYTKYNYKHNWYSIIGGESFAI